LIYFNDFLKKYKQLKAFEIKTMANNLYDEHIMVLDYTLIFSAKYTLSGFFCI